MFSVECCISMKRIGILVSIFLVIEFTSANIKRCVSKSIIKVVSREANHRSTTYVLSSSVLLYLRCCSYSSSDFGSPLSWRHWQSCGCLCCHWSTTKSDQLRVTLRAQQTNGMILSCYNVGGGMFLRISEMSKVNG